jgi:hypothetical protein
MLQKDINQLGSIMAGQGKTTTRLNLRTGPGTGHPSLRVLDPGTPLTVLEDTGDWLKVEVGGQQGFVHERFVAQETQAVPLGLAGTESDDPFPGVAMAPREDQLIRLTGRPTSSERLVAGTWNKAGNLLSELAGHLKFNPGAAVAVFCTESGGQGFGPDGRMLIRFENHHFFRHWGRAHQELFNTHFRFNPAKTWTGHQWRPSELASFENVHTDQSSEWRTFEFARTLDDTAAKLSISMGGPQILGSNHGDAGFESVHEMFDAFSASEKRQIVAFFDFLQGTETHPPKVLALQKMDFVRFAELYNGLGNAAEYSARISGAFDTFNRLRPASAAVVA